MNFTNIEKAKYNGHTIQDVENKISHMHQSDRRTYLNNVRRVIECQTTGFNLHEIEMRKNENHRITRSYLER